MARPADSAFGEIVRSTVALDGVGSAAIFFAQPGSSELELLAAAGIEGPALDGLTAAVRNPAHPIARTLVEATATYDVTPTAPGGPALRSHVPLVARHDPLRRTRGVLAIAHERSLDPDARRALDALADDAATALMAAPGDIAPPGPGASARP